MLWINVALRFVDTYFAEITCTDGKLFPFYQLIYPYNK